MLKRHLKPDLTPNVMSGNSSADPTSSRQIHAILGMISLACYSEYNCHKKKPLSMISSTMNTVIGMPN